VVTPIRFAQQKLDGGVNCWSVYIERMRISPKPFICISFLGVLGWTLQATIPERPANDYSEVPEQNLFGLKPPQAIQQSAPAPQLPKIVLTGITTILGNKRALMKTQPAAGKPGQPGQQEKEHSVILTEGQREGDIEVLQIDENAGSVKVNNSGTVMTLTFEKDDAKLPPTPAAPPLPGATPPVAGGVPVITTNQAVLNPALSNAPGMHPLPTRNFRMPALPAAATPTHTGPVPAPAVATQPSDLTPEEHAILQQIQREVNSTLTPVVSNVVTPPSAQPVAPLLPQ